MTDIVKFPSEILTKKCSLVEQFGPDCDKFIAEMFDAMYAFGGVGLAAPQIGVNKRVIVIDQSGGEEAGKGLVMINPGVTWRSSETAVGEEGCLSLPGVGLKIVRHVSVNVEYFDTGGRRHELASSNFLARIIQHEVDHLDGITMLDRVDWLTRKLTLKGLIR